MHHRIMDPNSPEDLLHHLWLIPVHADGPQIAVVDGSGLKQSLHDGQAVVRQVGPRNGGGKPTACIGIVGGTGKEQRVNIPLGLEPFCDFGRFLKKFRAAQHQLHIRQFLFHQPLNDHGCGFGPDNPDFHEIASLLQLRTSKNNLGPHFTPFMGLL